MTSAIFAQFPPTQAVEKQNDEAKYPPVSKAIMQAELKDIDGGRFRLDDFRGKVILVNLWASWCAPCRTQMADLVELQDKYDRVDFEVIGLNVGDGDASTETVRALKLHADRIKINYYLAQSTAAVSKGFYSMAEFDGIPISVLIDQDGRLRAVFRGAGPNISSSMRSGLEKVIKSK